MWREILLQALDNLRANRLRTVLSLLGIVIGVAAVVLTVGLTDSGGASVAKNFDEFGLDTLTVYLRHWAWPSTASPGVMDNDLLVDLRRELPGVVAINGVMEGQCDGWGSGKSQSITFSGVQAGHLEGQLLQMDYGRPISVSDEVQASAVAVSGADLAKELFPEGAEAGRYVTLNYYGLIQRFRLVGVLERKEMSMMGDPNRSIFLPLSTVQRRFSGSSRVDYCTVRLANPADAAACQGRIMDFGARKFGFPEAFYVASPQEWVENFQETKNTLSALFSGVAAIALLVGGIGIMNIMLVSVTERRREIGIRKALGARPGDIRAQFLIEAALLTGIGGIMGVAAGLGLTALVAQIMGWPFVAPVAGALVAFIFSFFMGIFFGYYPARRASRLDPIDALSAE